eukprot:1258197-Rhodomonas_salina.3
MEHLARRTGSRRLCRQGVAQPAPNTKITETEHQYRNRTPNVRHIRISKGCARMGKTKEGQQKKKREKRWREDKVRKKKEKRGKKRTENTRDR